MSDISEVELNRELYNNLICKICDVNGFLISIDGTSLIFNSYNYIENSWWNEQLKIHGELNDYFKITKLCKLNDVFARYKLECIKVDEAIQGLYSLTGFKL